MSLDKTLEDLNKAFMQHNKRMKRINIVIIAFSLSAIAGDVIYIALKLL